MQDAKDIIIALLGSAVGLAGLLLVVAGFVFSQAATFPPASTDDETISRYETAGKLGLIPFLLALAESALCVVWLIHCSSRIFRVDVCGFFLLLLLTAVYGSVLLLRYL